MLNVPPLSLALGFHRVNNNVVIISFLCKQSLSVRLGAQAVGRAQCCSQGIRPWCAFLFSFFFSFFSPPLYLLMNTLQPFSFRSLPLPVSPSLPVPLPTTPVPPHPPCLVGLCPGPLLQWGLLTHTHIRYVVPL